VLGGVHAATLVNALIAVAGGALAGLFLRRS
jgi:hypothetical protein